MKLNAGANFENMWCKHETEIPTVTNGQVSRFLGIHSNNRTVGFPASTKRLNDVFTCPL